MRKLKLSTLSGWIIALFVLFTSSNLVYSQCASGILEGNVYLDENRSGVNESEAGYPNAVVSVYDENNSQVGMALSNSNGNFSISGLTDGLIYRVEFTLASNVSVGFNDSDVQFAEIPSCDVALGVENGALDCGAQDDLVLTCFVRSDGTDNLDYPTVIGVDFGFDLNTTPLVYATQAETGSVWGTTYRYSSSDIFTSAFIKQNSALGSTHDAIYRTVPSGAGYSTSVFTTLGALGQSVGTLTETDPFNCDYGNQVGHLGLGGLAISAYEDDLYVINIGDNSLVKLSATSPTAATTVSYQIPDPGCGTNENRPFALTEYDGRFYVGVTCTAESTRTSSQSSVTVYEFDPNTAAFTHMFTTNATKGYWLDTPNTSNKIQQWLTDIAFTDEGNMVLALSDRKGHRFCEGPDKILNDQEGDLLLVANVNGQWVLESNGQAGAYQGSGVSNGEGLGGGEFFGGDFWLTDPSYHNETSLGSIYALPSSGEVVSAVFDPWTDAYSGGLHRYQTNNGSRTSAVQLYGNNSTEYFGKATGFGGITGKCGYAGIQIGDLAWFDLNNNGVQDPDEDPIDNLPLCLFDSNGTKLGSTNTDSDGHYVFSSAMHGLGYNSTYYIAIDPVIFNSADGTYTFNNLVLTPSFDTNVALNNSNLLFPPAGISSNIPDANHIINSGMPFITAVTGGNGENDYTFDIGLSEVEYFDLALIILSDTRIGEEGEDVKYTIEVENQGDVTANNIKIVNYIPDGMSLNDSSWTLDTDGVTAYKYINLSSGLEPGEMTEECITLTIVDRGEDYVKVNYAEIAYSENNAGVDFSPKDIDSTPDEINTNDFGGEAFSINDNRLDGSGVVGDDEDDHDSEGLYFVTFSISDPCECEGIDADGNVVHNETVTIQGPKGQVWTVDANIGLHDAAGVLIPVGTVIPVFDATDPLIDVYQIDGTLLNGSGFILRAMNEDGIFLNIEGQGCTYADLVITSEIGNASCIGSTTEYSVTVSENCTYVWTIDPVVPFVELENGTIEVVWAAAGDYVLTATPNCPDDACAAPATLTVTVGAANGILACPLDINISLDSECSVTITPEMILTTPVVVGVAYGLMITDSHGNVIPGTELTGEHLGQTLTVKVIDACSGNACWSNIIVEDKTAPILLCESIEVPCYDINTYEPIAYDACTTVEVEIIADFPTPIWCDDDYVKSIERTYKATDTYGNSTTCSQTILVKRFPYEDIVEPAEEVTITCTEADANQNADGYPSPCLTGVPTLLGASLYGEDGCESDLQYDFCDIAFTYTDVLYFVGDCKTKYMRTWHYYENNCTPFNYQNFTQLIVIEDNEVPVFDVALTTHNEIVTSNGNTCVADYILPVPVVSDDCAVALTYNVTYTTEAGIPTFLSGLTIADFNAGISIVLPFGDNVIKYTVFDGCDNFAEDMFVITIFDLTSPQAVCEGNTVVSLNEDGTAYAPATVFDDGSYDDCGAIEILVQRESVCDCPIPTFDGLNFLGSYDDGAGNTHYYYNSVRMVRGYLATALASAYGGYLVDFNSTAEQAYISNLMMVDAYVGGADYTTLSGGATTLGDGLDLQSFIVEIENPCGWSNEVHFCCEDYDADASTVDVEVSIRVIDAFGNIGECVPVNVYVQNKVIPLLDCPSDVELTCTESDLHEDITTEEELNTMFGTFTTDVCGAIIVPSTDWDLDACGVGVITRTFSALNSSNNSSILDINGDPVECVMTITIDNDDPLDYDDITWPVDYLEFEVECALTDLHPDVLAEIDEGQYGYPVVPIGDCHYATNPNFVDSAPFVTPDGRIKIIRTWTIFDECNDHNELTYIQKIKVTDLDLCEMLDVALRKTTVTPGPYNGGDVVTFAIEIFNQGNVDAFNVGVVDYIPTGLTFAVGTVNNASWTSIDANTAVLTTPIPTIVAGDPDPSTIVLIDLVIDATAAGNLDNYAEVTSVSNDPNNDPLTDIDSTPDDLNNDVFVNDIIGSDPTGGDEDDHDIETIFVEVFDLALIKQVNETLTDEPLELGGAIAFDITVLNQGNVDAFNIEIADYFPVELVLNDANWTAVGNSATLNTPISTLAVGQSTVVTVNFTVQDFAFFDANGYDLSQPLSIFNNAEISAAEDVNGPATDIDSEPGDNSDDDEDLSNDDEFDDGDGSEEEDDDFDPSDFEIDFYDLAIDKTLLTAGPYSPGGNVTFSLTVTNEGTLDAANIQITDMPAAGLIFVSDDSGASGNVTAVSGGTIYTITALAAGASETVEVTYMIATDFMGNTLNNYVEITTDDGDDVDSDPDNDSDDEDDDDEVVITLVQIFDLALIKEINTTLTDDPLLPGGSITFDITVLNQGTLDATNVEVSDYFPVELMLNDANWTALGNTATLNTLIASIPAGMSSVVSITFTLEDYAYFVANGIDLSMGLTLVNNAEVTAAEDNGVAVLTDADGTYGDNGADAPDLTNDDSFGDGDGTSPQDDDFDPAEFDVDIYDLAIDKTLLTAGPYSPGDNVTFSLTVTNEGTLDAANIQITDMPAAGLIFVSDDSGANGNVTAVSGGTIYTITALAAGASETVEVTYMIASDFMGNSLNNSVEITTDDGDDVDSDPDNDSDDEDDDDEEVITIGQEYDLAIDKEVTSAGPYTQGSTVTYTITVTNEGTLNAANVVFTDAPETGLNYVSSDAGSNSNVTESAGLVFTVASLPTGTTETVELTFTIAADFMGTSLDNYVQITGDDGDDIDSDPNDDSDDEDDDDEEVISVDQNYDLAIDKVITSAGPYTNGSTVTYTITVTNEGTLDAANVVFTDAPQTGLNYVSSDAAGNSNVTETAGLVFTVASLPIGATETVELTFTIADDFMGTSLTNYVEITGDDGDDDDSTTGNDSDDEDDDDEEEIEITQFYDLAIDKTITSTGPYIQGSTVTYTITVTNQGSLDAANVVFTDVPQTGLNYVSSDAAGNSNITESVGIVFTVGSLPTGASETVELTFMIAADFMGTSLDNYVQITSDDGDDVDSDPNDDSNDEDDDDEVEIVVDQIYDLAITKTLVPNADQPPYLQGDVVDFEIVITNQGSLTATGAQFTDSPQSGFTFDSDDSAGNANINIVTTGSVWSVTTLAPGASETLTVSYLIDLNFIGSTLTNDVMITLDDGDDIDSDPGTGDDTDEDGDGDGDDDDEDEVIVPIGCVIPTCGDLDFTLSLPASMDIPVTLYPYVDLNNMVQISTTPVIPTGFEGCQNTFTVTLDKDEIACNPKNNEDVKITILDVVAGTEECCIVTITKLDEIDPVLTCQDFTVNCNTLFYDADGNVDIEPFEPEATDNCEPVTITSTVDMSGLDEECNTGTIVIMYTATDCYDNTDICTQTITVNAVELQESEITFPDDITLLNCDDLSDTGTATVDADASVCGGLSIDFEDDIPADGECQEVITRTWTVIDSCALIGTGVFTHDQIITVTDDLGPVITGLPVLDNTYEVLPPSCMVYLDLVGVAMDACSQIDSIYHVINGDTILNSLDASDDFDIGSYTIEFVAVDICGNKTTEELEFTVAEPILAPGISCLKLSFEVGPGVSTIVTPEELAFGGFNCSDTDFTYEFVAGTPNSDLEPTMPITILGDQSISCADLNPYFIYIGLFEDGEYTGDFCIAEIDPVDVNPQDCPIMNNDEGSTFTGGVFGKIATETGTVVSDVQVDIIGDMTDMDMSTVEGKYEIGGLDEGGIYRVTPVKDIDYRNGVSTLDIILIQRHLLGLEDLNSPYKFIAADVNNSKSITAQDISELRKLILEVTDEFEDNTSWRMVDAGYEFMENVNPLDLNFPEKYDIYDFATVMEVDFVGVKIGDVNDSAEGPELLDIVTTVRQSQSLLTYSDTQVTPGKAQEVTLKLESKEAYYGFQTRLDLDASLVDLVSITSELPGFGPEHYTYVDGLLTVSYNTPSAKEVTGGEITLTLTASKTAINVADVIERDDTYVNEIYTAEGINEMILSSISGYSGFEVFQNSPNPFSDYTTIRYKLDESKEVSVKVFDVTGKVIYRETYNGTTGLNAIQLDKSLFNASGMHYYELTNGSQGVVKRMLYVK